MASALDTESKLSPTGAASSVRPGLASPALESFSMPFQPGEVIAGKYKVIRLIGTGGVGFVVAARHVGFDEVVALKFLRPEFATHPEAVSRFTIEARASFKIKSEHVARVLDVDTLADGTPFIAMELLEGTDLRSLLDRCRMLAIEPAVDYVLQTCEALAAAHALRIIHRDIKPENLFLTGPGDETDQIKVLDFGISKVALTGTGRQTNQALTRIAVGTPPYMSPEQVRACRDLDARSDIWSLGCVLYELLTGTAPFDRLSLMQSCAAVLEEDPVPLRDVRPVISHELDDVVLRCLQKDPAARFQDVAELAEALTPFGSGQLATYSERCRAFLTGEGFLRRSTPNTVPPVRRVSVHPPSGAYAGQPHTRRSRGGMYPSAAEASSPAQPARFPTRVPRNLDDDQVRPALRGGRNVPLRRPNATGPLDADAGRQRYATGLPRVPSTSAPRAALELRQGLPVAHPGASEDFSELPAGLRGGPYHATREVLESLEGSHVRRTQLPPPQADPQLIRETVLSDDYVSPRRSRRWPWVVAASAALGFGAAYLLARDQLPVPAAHFASAIRAGAQKAATLHSEVAAPAAPPAVTQPVAAQPSQASAPALPAAETPSAGPGAPAATPAASDVPSGAAPPSKEAAASNRPRPKAVSKPAPARKFRADDEIDVGF